MSKHVVYEGATPASRLKLGLPPVGHGPLEFHVEDEDGELFRLYEGVTTPVSDSLAKELLEGSERTAGHDFREASRDEKQALEDAGVAEDEAPPAPSSPTAPVGGPGGSGPATGEGTTAAASR